MTDLIFLGSKITEDGDCNQEIKRRLFLGRKAMTKLDSILKSRDHFADKGLYSQSYRWHHWFNGLEFEQTLRDGEGQGSLVCYSPWDHKESDMTERLNNNGFPSSHVQMWELDHKEGWATKNWHFQTVLVEKSLESPLGSKEVKLVNPKGNQFWIFIGRTDAEAPILWSPVVESQLTGKDLFFFWKISRSWERLRAEEGDRGWDHWMVSLNQWTWVWANSRR